jgi:dTMP kinase
VPARGLLLTLEGPDGAGKSSQAELLGDRLREAGIEPVLTREPGGTLFGERVRRVLLENDGAGHEALADALLFNAARRQLVSEVIRPALERGAIVVCDRYADSTLAYQGYGAGVPLTDLQTLADIATGGLRPDRTVLLDLAPDAGLARRAGGPGAELTRFELADAHDLDFHRRVRDGYLRLAASDPIRWRTVDASRPAAELGLLVWRAVADLFADR